ncbi:hypothetical protein B7495_11830 [Cryobacterium sp. LW097]|uniref:hypothetical protein n=1 Tax=unclassified Cryobacterium TaxID=2649013 RepID=UPI000B4CB3C8|nr:MULTISPECIES: hypothetical protein [unclassified Cryobacterium]TFC50959.1 hypothetical protein E3O68_15605 [Cryobacterium sp. TMB3-1-2]ASD22681.1 hypothetical protein B7495_11830 [Cryobacterium sp. LW097]TFC74305.1 hypothetical protein E3T21_01895 [Cryobacterium sp. TMB3-15]TFC79818.1 hypothetical protein E3T22_00170 [Cryobacterium sp. TMB3-10]TFD40769.1 hypothetical protein E3T58_12425 [Cryobacterium sp. TMB3-12]
MLISHTVRHLLIVALCALVPVIGLMGLAVSAQANEDPDGVSLTVSVLGSTSAPSPAATTRASTRPAAPVTSLTTQVTPVGSAATEALGTDPVVMAGVLAVSGLTATAHPTAGPDGGDIVLTFTVKNLTDNPISSSLRFWVDNAVGLQIRAANDASLTDLAGGETRTVTTTFTDVSQWSVFNSHVTLTPPDSVDGTAMTPVTRDALLLVPPYFVLLVASLVVGLSVAARYAFLTKRLFPVSVAETAS